MQPPVGAGRGVIFLLSLGLDNGLFIGLFAILVGRAETGEGYTIRVLFRQQAGSQTVCRNSPSYVF